MSDTSPLFGEVLVKLGLVSRFQVEEALALQPLTGQRVGEALVSLGHVTREQLKEALLEALGLANTDARDRPRLGRILVDLKHLTDAQLQEGLARQRQDGRRLGEILVELGYCSHQQIYEALGLQAQGPKGGPAPPGATPKTVQVLLVDDSPITCSFVSEGLGALGFEVHAFQDPFEALEQVARIRPSIVLSDWEMPGLSGAELCQRLKSGPFGAPPVIILTGNDEEVERIRGLKAGADDYVSKGASMEEIAARLESVLRRTSETERVRKMFARYTSDAVVNEIMKSGDVVLTGERREVTVLFADIRNFTSLAEGLSPERVMGILNDVLGKSAEAVLALGGTLDKFLGDGLMAVFGAPVSRPDDALRAIQAAQRMLVSLDALRAELARDHREGRRPDPPPPLALGIGINSGEVIAGNLGSQIRTEYTVIGDPVNVAARLCSMANPGEILVGERTRELAGDAVPFEPLPPTLVKGKARPVSLYRALGI